MDALVVELAELAQEQRTHPHSHTLSPEVELWLPHAPQEEGLRVAQTAPVLLREEDSLDLG